MGVKIILIGLPKSGTTSFQSLFERLGYKSYHQHMHNIAIGMKIKTNKKNNEPLLEGFENDCCITQLDICQGTNNNYWPQISDFKQLYYENPDCIFILNKRDIPSLLQSWKKQIWRGVPLDKRLFRFNPELVDQHNDKGFEKFVNDHYESVETFFDNHKEAKFMTFDIINDDVSKLTQYINIDKCTKMPHKNYKR